jgi:hypothetical protein
VARPGSNLVECVFQVPHAGRGLAGWRGAAERSVAALRYHGHPEDPRLHDLIGALSVRDEDFRRMWADFDARPLTSGTVPVVVDGEGLVAVPWQVLGLPDDLFLAVLTAPAGTPAGDVLARERERLGRRAQGGPDRSGAVVRLTR